MLAGTVAFLTTLRASWRKRPEVIRTTLYDLIATMQDEGRPEDDALIVDTVADLIYTGRIRLLNEVKSQRADC